MKTASIHLNGVAPRPVAHGSGRIWPVMIIGFLSLNASIVAVTVYFATSDKSVATEPDYYAKALGYNDTLRQRSENERLGWKAVPTLRPAADGHSMELSVALVDRTGEPLADAAVGVVAFPGLRSGDRQSLSLRANGSPGQYVAPIHIDSAGEWCFRISASAGLDTFSTESRLIVSSPAAPAPTTH